MEAAASDLQPLLVRVLKLRLGMLIVVGATTKADLGSQVNILIRVQGLVPVITREDLRDRGLVQAEVVVSLDDHGLLEAIIMRRLRVVVLLNYWLSS